jgi:hypothetical protein
MTYTYQGFAGRCNAVSSRSEPRRERRLRTCVHIRESDLSIPCQLDGRSKTDPGNS